MLDKNLILNLPLDGKIQDNLGTETKWVGSEDVQFASVQGRQGLSFNGNGYLQLANDLLKTVNDETGFTFSAWVYIKEGTSAWERIFDFGSGEGKPSVFFTRNFRATLSGFGDLVADGSKRYTENQWVHLTYVYTPTDKARNSSAGGRVYIDGELVGDGLINQTTSGLFGKLKLWTALFEEEGHYTHNYLGHSQYDADADFNGILSDVSLYNTNLDERDILSLMAQTLGDEDIINIAKNRDLDLGLHVISDDLDLKSSLFGGLVDVEYTSSNPDVLGHDGRIMEVVSPEHVSLSVALKRGAINLVETFDFTVLPKEIPGYKIKVKPEVLSSVSDIMYGLFYEDINNAADGGIYAELIRNRSFESFTFDDFMPNDNVCGCESGRSHDHLQAWYGDTDKVVIHTKGGLRDHLNLDAGVNENYIEIEDATIINKGYNDTNHDSAMLFRKGSSYDFSLWFKGEGKLTLNLLDDEAQVISEALVLELSSEEWTHEEEHSIQALKSGLGQISIQVEGKLYLDNFSLMPANVWGNEETNTSDTAASNYAINKNYRMRADLVHALQDLKPKFLRFPGGCISEGAFVWDNVFDWKQTMGPIEVRKENFNLWGYSMTMGLGYFEYFQLAEDLDAFPVPVMACGVLCQARSDYAAPAGGSLRDYYISNFTDLIDFAISMDFENNQWAKMRRDLGHETPFDLKYLGVGNENWGDEFFANFEVFNHEIEKHMAQYHPEHELHIISTVGAQADDDAFQDGWKFLHGDHKGVDTLEFTDGHQLFNEDIKWYEHADHYMNTIADEHYYRTNDYLKNNVDRYNYYKRVYNEDGSVDQNQTSKVFVGEYASTDKNTLHGAISEAALMTGFENNADVVVMASYAPLFNKVLTDATYRWTPDLIWFDNEDVWFTPNYYNQKMFANNIGTQVLKTDYSSYVNGQLESDTPKGAITISAIQSEILIQSLKVVSNLNGDLIFEQDFTQALSPLIKVLPHGDGFTQTPDGLLVSKQEAGVNGIVIDGSFENYQLELVTQRISGDNALLVGVGVTSLDAKSAIEYAIDYVGHTSGLRVFKDGVEGYRMGDFSTSVLAGNMRRSHINAIENNTAVKVSINFGLETLKAHYETSGSTFGAIEVRNEVYKKELFNTVSEDDKALYIKLVNIDNVSKRVELDVTAWNLHPEAKLTVLTGEESLLDQSNVNAKEQEPIQPKDSLVFLEDGILDLVCPKLSVSVIRIDKK